MARLYITEQQAILRKAGDRLIVEKDHETAASISAARASAATSPNTRRS
jgi:hypothetical protein